MLKPVIFILTGLLLLSTPETIWAKNTVFEGLPIREDQSEGRQVSKRDLSVEESQGLRTVISKEGEQFFWDSFEGKELHHVERDGIDFFINPEGEGFVKIKFDPETGIYYYMECITSKQKKSTFIGTAKKLDL